MLMVWPFRAQHVPFARLSGGIETADRATEARRAAGRHIDARAPGLLCARLWQGPRSRLPWGRTCRWQARVIRLTCRRGEVLSRRP